MTSEAAPLEPPVAVQTLTLDAPGPVQAVSATQAPAMAPRIDPAVVPSLDAKVSSVRFEGKNVDGATLKSVSSYFVLYMVITCATFLILSVQGFDLETNLSATISCFNNIGPGLGAVGPAGNFSAYNGFNKLVLSLAMLLGRLEIMPLILSLSPAMWAKKRTVR